MTPASSKELLDIQANYRVCIHSDTRTWHDNNIQSNAPYRWAITIIWPVLLNGWVFVYKLSGCGFESRCCHLIHFYFWHWTCIYLLWEILKSYPRGFRHILRKYLFSVDTTTSFQRLQDVHATLPTSYRRLKEVERASCFYWVEVVLLCTAARQWHLWDLRSSQQVIMFKRP